jgi:hypothetical protein
VPPVVLLFLPSFVCIPVHSWLLAENLKKFSLNRVEEIKYKLVDVQPAKAVIVNTQKPNEPIEIGFGAP